MLGNAVPSTSLTPFAKDIRMLIRRFDERKTYSAKAFKEEWKKFNFSMIHNGCPDEIDKELYTQELFCITMGYLMLEYPLRIHIAALYMLYFLYMTQPENPKVKIRMSTMVFEVLLNLRQKIREENILDAYYILNELHDIHAFYYCAVVKLDETQSLLDSDSTYGSLSASSIDEIDPSAIRTIEDEMFDTDYLKDVAQLYNTLKSDVQKFDSLSLAEATTTSESNTLKLVQPNFVNSVEQIIQEHEQQRIPRIEKFIEEWKDMNKPKKRGQKKRKTAAASSTSSSSSPLSNISTQKESANEKVSIKTSSSKCSNTISSINDAVNQFLNIKRKPLSNNSSFEKSKNSGQKKKESISERSESVKRTSSENEQSSQHEDTCYICGEGGLLICCETCEHASHTECAGLKEVPEDEWYCHICKSL